MTNKTFQVIIYICLIIVLSAIYIACFEASQNGYGYPGYRGFGRPGHSFFYFKDYEENYYQSNRENSVGGNKFSQRGLSGGK